MITISKWRRRLTALVVVTCASMAPVIAVAQGAAKKTEEEHPSWALSYTLVILAIALGLLAICRPGSRSEDYTIVTEE